MHRSSLDKMDRFVQQYMGPHRGQCQRILDLGSFDVNGSYRHLFDDPAWEYQGLDMEKGKNVDIVLENPYRWKEIKPLSQDIIISGQAFEHIEYFWVVMDEIVRVLKPGGLICIIAPSRGYEHRYPVDCWRFYPDAFRALARFSGLELIEVTTQWKEQGYTEDDSDIWGDTTAVLRRPLSWSLRFRMFLVARRMVNIFLHGY